MGRVSELCVSFVLEESKCQGSWVLSVVTCWSLGLAQWADGKASPTRPRIVAEYRATVPDVAACISVSYPPSWLAKTRLRQYQFVIKLMTRCPWWLTPTSSSQTSSLKSVLGSPWLSSSPLNFIESVLRCLCLAKFMIDRVGMQSLLEFAFRPSLLRVCRPKLTWKLLAYEVLT